MFRQAQHDRLHFDRLSVTFFLEMFRQAQHDIKFAFSIQFSSKITRTDAFKTVWVSVIHHKMKLTFYLLRLIRY